MYVDPKTDELYVADGYGKSWVHQYNEKREYIRSFGGPGDRDDQMASPHGIAPLLSACDAPVQVPRLGLTDTSSPSPIDKQRQKLSTEKRENDEYCEEGKRFRRAP